jgi:uncharacterized protein YnzC (UPF0291/DUF896 family)
MQVPQQMAVPQQMQAPQMQVPQMDIPGELRTEAAPHIVAKFTKKGVPRKTPNRQMTKDERMYVINNYSKKSTGQIATELNLTRQQVYRTVYESRTKIKERIEAANAIGDVATVQKLQTFLVTNLPEKEFSEGGGGRSKGGSIDSTLDALFNV